MLRKFRDFKQLTPSLKSATGKLKSLVSLHTLSRLQEANQDENMALSAEQETMSECVWQNCTYLKMFPHFRCFYKLRKYAVPKNPRSLLKKQWTFFPLLFPARHFKKKKFSLRSVAFKVNWWSVIPGAFSWALFCFRFRSAESWTPHIALL